MNTVSLEISERYLTEHSTNFDDYANPLEWAERYCKRNRIDMVIFNHQYRDGTEEPYYRFTFKSDTQLHYFVLNGNNIFEYFEFL